MSQCRWQGKKIVDQHQNLRGSPLGHAQPLQKISWKLAERFLRNLAYKQTDKREHSLLAGAKSDTFSNSCVVFLLLHHHVSYHQAFQEDVWSHLVWVLSRYTLFCVKQRGMPPRRHSGRHTHLVNSQRRFDPSTEARLRAAPVCCGFQHVGSAHQSVCALPLTGPRTWTSCSYCALVKDDQPSRPARGPPPLCSCTLRKGD